MMRPIRAIYVAITLGDSGGVNLLGPSIVPAAFMKSTTAGLELCFRQITLSNRGRI
jgi:hypothetical protein